MSTNWHLAEPVPAVVAHPVAASLDEAHAAIELWEFYSRKRLDGAQRLAVEHMLAEADDGLWAASSTGRAESRQNGKGDEIEVVELWGLTQRGEAILHTAHEAATAASAHNRLRDLILDSADLRRKLGRNSRGQEAVQSWNGNYRIEMADGSLIVHRTRTSAIGRGLDDISRLVVDEAQHAQAEELASATPILAANPNPQKNYIGSAGVAGKSGFWWRLRKEALKGGQDRFGWLEHSAEVVTINDKGEVSSSLGDVGDRDLWRRANPAYPARISDDFLLGQLRDLGPEHFAREHLCVWDPEPGMGGGIVSMTLWSACLDAKHRADGHLMYALDVAPESRSAAVAVSDGTHVEVVKYENGTAWVVPVVAAKVADGTLSDLFLDPAGPAGALIAPLEAAGVKVREVSTREATQAAQAFLTDVEEARLRHIGQTVLDAAVANADRRDVGDGGWLWSRKKSSVDICPLYAATLARWAATVLVPVARPAFKSLGDYLDEE